MILAIGKACLRKTSSVPLGRSFPHRFNSLQAAQVRHSSRQIWATPLVLVGQFGYLYANLSTTGENSLAPSGVVGVVATIGTVFNHSGKGHGWPTCTSDTVHDRRPLARLFMAADVLRRPRRETSRRRGASRAGVGCSSPSDRELGDCPTRPPPRPVPRPATRWPPLRRPTRSST